MPTPSPIIAASAGVKSLVSSTWVASVTRLSPVPSATSAVTIGRPMATTEPKVSSSTAIAATIAIASLRLSRLRRSTRCTGGPPASTCRPGRAAARAVSTTARTADRGSSNDRRSNCTVANAVRPSRETPRGPSAA